jgi:hypothetical protein
MNVLGRVSTSLPAALLAVMTIQAPASAADCGPSANVPAGSYRQTCTACSVGGGNLTAWCKTMRNQDQQTTLYSYPACRSGIENLDGFLTCSKGDPAPNGTYKASCRNINVEKGTLYASCRTVNGGWKEANLQLGYCNYQIYNTDGALACTLPYGTYQRSCRNAHVMNGQLSAECKTASGGWLTTSVSAVCNRDLSNNDGRLTCN